MKAMTAVLRQAARGAWSWAVSPCRPFLTALLRSLSATAA
jgi:hypothetical protein